MFGKKIGVERPEALPDFFVVGEIVGKGQGEESDMTRGGGYLRHQAVNVGEKGVRLPLVIRGKNVAELENSIGFYLTFSRCAVDAVVTI